MLALQELVSSIFREKFGDTVLFRLYQELRGCVKSVPFYIDINRPVCLLQPRKKALQVDTLVTGIKRRCWGDGVMG